MTTPLDGLDTIPFDSLNPDEGIAGWIATTADPTGHGQPEFQITTRTKQPVDGGWAAGSWTSDYGQGLNGAGSIDWLSPLVSTLLPPSWKGMLVLWIQWNPGSPEHPRRRACLLSLG